MKENLLALGMFIGFFLMLFSVFIIPITLLNNYLIYSCVFGIGLIVSVAYIFYKKDKITDVKEYFYIPIRITFCFGPILVFSFLWLNFFWRDKDEITIKIPVESFFLVKESYGGKFSNKIRIKSVFVINYKGQNKNIFWNTRLEDTIMTNVKEIEIIKRKGFFGVDIIEDTDLIYQEIISNKSTY